LKYLKWIIIAVLTAVLIIASLVFIYFKANFLSVNTNFAETITLEVRDYHNREGFAVQINQEDVATLKKLFRGMAFGDSPACPFGSVALIFSAENRTVTLYPAGDDCGLVRIIHNGQNYYLILNEEDNRLMREVLEKYGVGLMFGI